MATSRNLGFEKSRNLFESTNDREVLNNLGGGDIASDIALFVNNTNNKSELKWKFGPNPNTSKIESNKFVFSAALPFVYNNDDEVQVTGDSLGNLETDTVYYVVGLDLNQGDNEDQPAFGLSLTLGGSLVSLGTITDDVTFIRADSIVLEWEFGPNTSKIESNKYVFPTTVPFVYTNGDEVQVTGTSLGNLETNKMYYVVGLDLSQGDRRNQAAFGLALEPNGSLVSLGAITDNVTFIRADIVTQENLLNIATPRILDSNAGLTGDTFSYNIGASFGDAFDVIEGNIDGFNFLRSSKYIQNDSTAINRPITIEGTLDINDPANFNSTEANLAEDKSPGVYISDPFSDILNISRTRAFSTSAQPWEVGTGELITTSAQVNIGDLNFQSGISFETITDLSTASGSVTEFTHKIPVLIAGVEYFILLKS
jgi:hypothetical protein